MLYYYAHTGHKIGLDRAKRGVAVIKALQEEGVSCQLLVNDFRAGVALKEHGLREYVTIETIQDIDAIAQMGDSIIIDSNEDDHGRLVKYVADFKQVWRFAHDRDDKSIHGEILFKEACESDRCIDSVVIDKEYFRLVDKVKSVRFFLGDADYDKTILSNSNFFKQFDMDLILGHYFFVKYEDDLAKIFNSLIEPEEYIESIKESKTVVTCSSQTALEAKASGADTIYIIWEKEPLYTHKLLQRYGIKTITGFDAKSLKEALQESTQEETGEALSPWCAKEILQNL